MGPGYKKAQPVPGKGKSNTRPHSWALEGKAFEVPVRAGRGRAKVTGAANAVPPCEMHALIQEKANARSTIALWEKMAAIHYGKQIVHA